jgi:hypothetical protein
MFYDDNVGALSSVAWEDRPDRRKQDVTVDDLPARIVLVGARLRVPLWSRSARWEKIWGRCCLSHAYTQVWGLR